MTTTIKQIVQWGNSLGVRISKDAAARAGISRGSSVRVTSELGKLTLVPLPAEETAEVRIPQYSLKKLLRTTIPQDLNSDAEWFDVVPVGKEII